MKKSTLLQFLGFPCCDSYDVTRESGLKLDFSKSNTTDCCWPETTGNVKSKSMFSIFLLFVLFLFSNFLTAQITVDGNPIDWNSANFNTFPVRSYVPDPYGTGVVDNQYTSSKDFFLAGGGGQGHLGWVMGQTKAKNDIANAAAVVSNNILYFAGDRTSNNGDAQIGFWFMLNGTGPAPGGTFEPPHAVGDLLVLADFTGGGNNATVTIYRWVGGGPLTPGSAYVVGSNNNLETTNLVGTVAENNASTYPIPTGWSFISPTYLTNEFYEGQVNLASLNLANTCFSSFILEARSSQSITASLDDFAGGAFNVRPTVSINSVTVCNGQSATFTATANGGVAPLTYSFNGGPFTSSNTFTINPATASTTVSVVVQGGPPNNCQSPAATGTLTVNNAPTCSITGQDLVCPSSTNAHSGPAGTGYTYAWSISGNGTISGSTSGQNVSVNAGSLCGQTYTISLTVSLGNCSSTCTKTVTVNDTTPPTFTFCPPGAALGCNPSGVPAPGAATATDNCGTPTITSALGQISAEGCARSQTRTYTATDACGNTATCTQIFTWTETTAPVLAGLPTGGALGCNPTHPVCSTAVTASNECGPVAPVTCTPGEITSNGCNRSQTFTYSATACGLTGSATVTYTWTETTAPVLAGLPTGGALGCNPTHPVCSTAVTASNECGAVDVTCTPGQITSEGCDRSQTFTYSATACGLTGSANVTYTWKEVAELVPHCPGNLTVLCGEDAGAAFANWIGQFSYSGGGCANTTATDLTQFVMPEPGQLLEITYTVTDDCQTATCKATFFVSPCALCTYTQGAYGSEGGAMCDGEVGNLSTAGMIAQILAHSGGTITVGKPGRSVVMTAPSAVDCIIDRLPGGGGAKELPVGNINICALPASMLKNGRINNSLLAQTITLSLNAGISSSDASDLNGLALQGGTIATAEPLGGCGSSIPTERVCGHYNQFGVWVNTTHEYSYRTISAAVINAITPNGDGDRTVAGLIDLANRALGNVDGIVGTENGVSLSAISGVVDAINNAFDECKIFVGFNVAPCPPRPAAKNESVAVTGLSVVAYPNPFASNFKIDVKTSSNEDLQIKVYDTLGRLLETNNVKVSNAETLEIGNNYPAGVYNVIVTQGTEVKTQRVIKR